MWKPSSESSDSEDGFHSVLIPLEVVAYIQTKDFCAGYNFEGMAIHFNWVQSRACLTKAYSKLFALDLI